VGSDAHETKHEFIVAWRLMREFSQKLCKILQRRPRRKKLLLTGRRMQYNLAALKSALLLPTG